MPGHVPLVTTPSRIDLIEDVLATAEAERPVALGWATVELDRAALELAAELRIGVAAFLPAADSVVLGARCRIAYGVLTGGRPLVLLEPATEGLLAVALARRGEGPAATWDRAADATTTPGTGTAQPGPFGLERLAPGGPAHGPYRLLIDDGPGTIHR